MGRLTLNVLHSFAQFEREVTGERIRDKIAASKKKGLLMGGPVPLGHEVIGRKLVPVEVEAARVRHIMWRYIELPSAPALLIELEEEGVFTKVQQRVSGPHRGGIPFGRGSLFYLLKNPVYRGMIVHKDAVYPGGHEAIVDEELWHAVQSKLKERAPPRLTTKKQSQAAMLAGLLTDLEGRPMAPSFSCRGTRRYRYHTTRWKLARDSAPKATRFSIRTLDRHVIAKLNELLSDEHALRRLGKITDAALLARVLRTARSLVACLNRERTIPDAVRAIVKSIKVTQNQLLFSIRPESLGFDPDMEANVHSIEWPRRKPFREQKLRLDAPGDDNRVPDQAVVQLLRDARQVQKLVLAHPDLPLHCLAKREGRCRKHMTKLLRVSWLSPRIVESILDGRQQKRLTRKRLLETDLPACWNQQEELLGFSHSN